MFQAQDRTLRLSIVEGTDYGGTSIGNGISGKLFKAIGYSGVFGVSAACLLVAVLYGAIFVKESLKLPNDDNNMSQNAQIENKDLQITFVKKEHSSLSKTKVQLTINRDNEDTEVFRILIRKPPNSVTLADVKQHLMSNPKKYNNFNGDLFEYNVKTNIDGIDGFEDCDEEEDDVATLPLIENQIVLKCWYKS